MITIRNHIVKNYPVISNFDLKFRLAMHRLVDQKKLLKYKNSFALTQRKRKTTRRKRVAKKEGEEKKTKKTTTKKSTTSKKSTRVQLKSKKPAALKKQKTASTSKKVKSPPAHAVLKRGESVVAVPSSKYAHFWQYWDGGWQNYDIKASDEVEKVYLDYLKNRGNNDVRAVKSGMWEYQVDFLQMVQTNINHEAHTTRKIRRIPNTAVQESE